MNAAPNSEPPLCEKCGERHYGRTHPFRTLKHKSDAAPRRYEADGRGCIYEEYEDGSVWPTGIVIRHLAGQSQIAPEVFERELRRLDELEGRA